MFPKDLCGGLIVIFGEVTVEGRHGIESVGENECGECGSFFPLRFGNDLAHAYHIDIAVERFSDVGIEQAGKIVFVVAEFGRNGIERNRFGIMFVDIIECLNDNADIGRRGDGYGGIMRDEVPEDDIDQAFFGQFRGGRIFFERVESREVGNKRRIKIPIGKMAGQSFVLQKVGKIFGKARADDQNVVNEMRIGFQFMDAAFVYERDLIFRGDERHAVDAEFCGTF